MQQIGQIVIDFFTKNSFVMAFFVVGVLTLIADIISKKLTHGKIHSSAIAIFIGLVLAYIGGKVTGGEKGISDIGIFAGIGVLGGASFRDFAIISTAYGAKFSEIKKCGVIGIVSLILGVISAFVAGAVVAYAFGYRDAVSVSTIASGAVTFVVGPVTGAAFGAESTVIAISIAVGLVKSIAVMLLTPVVAKRIGLVTPQAAMIYGGLMGTTSGTSAGLAATDPSLVPYGAMTATFYTGLGCLLCPSILYSITNWIL